MPESKRACQRLPLIAEALGEAVDFPIGFVSKKQILPDIHLKTHLVEQILA